MIEHYKIWEYHCKNVLRGDTDSWQPSAKIDLEEGNPIYAIHNPFILKALRIIHGSPSDTEAYGMWTKPTSIGNIIDDSISEYVFRYRYLDEATLEAFKLFFTVWVNPDTDQPFMNSLINRVQQTGR
ncbi:hypothetical protein [Spirosoma pollinicola]|uniref:Uncharacterized protein n=1 Tax=Spirosoma pollinicola TaxID=2057025 RepID=A0A2K8Z2N0_9BACT|nr:hypothetical protein [Spirosoma pollinicola]AUD04127.1 hypothetical protein CWM47_21205 [Spirosoma pollinicola]